jgi:hypothetical protein
VTNDLGGNASTMEMAAEIRAKFAREWIRYNIG